MGFFNKDIWGELSPTTLKNLKEKLGGNRFNELDKIAKKYQFHKQRIFDKETNIDGFVLFLNSAGNQLFMHNHDSDDVEFLWQCSLSLQPSNNPAHTSLAIFYHTGGRMEEAKEEARQAIKVIDYYNEQSIGINIPEEIRGDPNEAREIRKQLQKIAGL